MIERAQQYPSQPWRQRLFQTIFESDTPSGRRFDIVLLVLIVLSVVVVIVDSIAEYRALYGSLLRIAEWVLTAIFTIEYILRLAAVRRPLTYALSFFGIVDLLAIAPTYLSLLLPGTEYLLAVRILRLLRIFRILKAAEYLSEANTLGRALWATRRKISVFLTAVVTIVIIVGALMYVVEGEAHGFVNIPVSIYWAVVTLTTVGYGDIAPRTPFGQFLASIVMLLGYGILAVPTGIVSAEIARGGRSEPTAQTCPTCTRQGHDADATHCKYCGGVL
jgi:voltage-gated potassium channel